MDFIIRLTGLVLMTKGKQSQMHALLLILALALSGCQNTSSDNSLPVTFHPDYGLPLVNIGINGETMLAYVDTGANFLRVCLPKQDIERLGAHPNGKVTRFFGLGGMAHASPEYDAFLTLGVNAPIKTSIQEFKEWGFTMGQKPYDSLGLKPAYIGLRLLKHYTLFLDFSKNDLRLYPPSFSPTGMADWTEIPFTVTASGIEFPLKLEGSTVQAILDTGASRSLLIQDPSIFSDHHHRREFAQKIILTGLQIGKLLLDPLTVIHKHFPKPDVHLILGCDFLKHHQLYISFKDKRIWIRKAAPQIENHPVSVEAAPRERMLL
ncbi:MAG: hypothetical protein NTX76_03155 [Alphaproteobacteria bacterium]|nr:hypothetical protein [Alphaproteobacteria bacterium]